MSDTYTHTFEFKVGSKFITGECEFDTDNKMSFNINTVSDPFSYEVLEYFLDFMKLGDKIYKEANSIELIRIKKK